VYEKLEAMGSGLVGLLVPKIDAAAGCGPEGLERHRY
jgi:hypothetical protein